MTKAHIDWVSTAVTDTGLVRSVNEDAYLDLPGQLIWAVADGMGGYEAGDWASSTIVQALQKMTASENLHEAIEQTKATLASVNIALREQAALRSAGMIGSTVVVFIARGARSGCLWAGDCRAYLLRDNVLLQLTQDHSRVQEMVNVGQITQEEARTHPESNIVTRALGVMDEVEIDHVELDVKVGDLFLLCSDGLINEMSDAEIQVHLSSGDTKSAVDNLLVGALASGAKDNVTILVARAYDDSKTLLHAGAGEHTDNDRTILSRD